MSAQARHDALVAAALDRAKADGCTRCNPNVCGDHFDPQIEEEGWNAVAERMDRWGANGYVGDWQDPQYDEVATR